MTINSRSTKLAEALYRKLINEEQLNKLLVNGFSESVTTDLMMNSDAWLGPIMLKADEISIAINGKRLWDVFYIIDKSCIEGIRAVDTSARGKFEQSEVNVNSLATYDEVEIDSEVSPTESYLIARLSLISSVRIFEDGKVDMVPIRRMPPQGEASFSDGQVVPLYSEKIIKANFLNEALSSALRTNEAMLSHSVSTPSVEPSRV